MERKRRDAFFQSEGNANFASNPLRELLFPS